MVQVSSPQWKDRVRVAQSLDYIIGYHKEFSLTNEPTSSQQEGYVTLDFRYPTQNQESPIKQEELQLSITPRGLTVKYYGFRSILLRHSPFKCAPMV